MGSHESIRLWVYWLADRNHWPNNVIAYVTFSFYDESKLCIERIDKKKVNDKLTG